MKIRKNEKYDRNLEIYEKKMSGASWTELAREYNMANSVLQRIVARVSKRESVDNI